MDNLYKDEAEIVLRHTQRWLMNSNETVNSFAVDMLAPKLGRDAPTTAAEYESWRSNLTRMVRRYFSGQHNMPLSWKWPWLECLPEPHKKNALKEIYALHGFLDTLPKIDAGTACDAALDELLSSVSDMVGNAAPAHDGVYDSNDSLEKSNAMIDSLLSLAVKATDEARKIHAGTGATGCRHSIHQLPIHEDDATC